VKGDNEVRTSFKADERKKNRRELVEKPPRLLSCNSDSGIEEEGSYSDWIFEEYHQSEEGGVGGPL